MLTAIFTWLRGRSRPVPASTPAVEPLAIVDAAVERSASHLGPYDENLLERARTQWQFGDWTSLARLDRDTLAHHPDRAKLALLAASAHQQNNDMAAARQFLRLAQEWGCSKRHLTQILVAGAYNTLGRAAALNAQEGKALGHFEAAVAIGMPGSDAKLITQARAAHQLSQLGMRDAAVSPMPVSAGQARAGGLGALAGNRASDAASEQLKKQNAELLETIRKQSGEIAKMKKDIQSSLKQEMLNATKQLEAYLGIQSYLRSGELMPELHGWPISPDFALYLIELIEANDYDLVIEFGSGTSTSLIAKTLRNLAAKRRSPKPTAQLAFEHLEQYHRKTKQLLAQDGMEEAVELMLAPLEPYRASNGEEYRYYRCHETLERLAANRLDAGQRILVLVDGPPGATGRHARYPALPVVLASFAGARIDFLLDDYNRTDEKEVVQQWIADLCAAGVDHAVTERKLEKDACLIAVTGSGSQR